MDHYFTNNPNLKSEIKLMIVNILDKNYYLYTDKGVFSKDKLDFGTELLIKTLPLNEMKGNVLDVGCGYGPIGLVIKRETDCSVDMIDVNLRALHLAKMNANKNDLDVNIYESDAYAKVTGSYDYIVTNPPIRAGKKIVYEILIKSRDLLKQNGELWFVMRKDQGVKSAVFELEKYYDLVIKGKKKGFYIICARKQLKIIDNA